MTRRGRALALAAGFLLLAAPLLFRSSSSCGERSARDAVADEQGRGAGDAWHPPGGEERAAPGSLLPPPPPSTGWEEAAETVVAELRGMLAGVARPGAFAEAQAEAARADLALYPPPRALVRRALLGGERERAWALAAAAALPDPDDDLVGLALRLQRPDDDEVIRLLGAELVDSLPPELLSRHQEELLRAFSAEGNPLVLAVALPAMERLDEGGLRALVEAQLQIASPEMLPILVALARDRMGPTELDSIGILVTDGSGGDR